MLQPNCFFASYDFFDDPIAKNKLSGLEVQVRSQDNFNPMMATISCLFIWGLIFCTFPLEVVVP